MGKPDNPRSRVVGYLKDECAENIITEYVSLKPKAYSYTTCPLTLYDPTQPGAPALSVKSKQVAKRSRDPVLNKSCLTRLISKCYAK